MSGKMLLQIGVAMDETNEEIYDYIQKMKHTRETEKNPCILCYIGGWDKDKRELFDIPEVRALCRRFVNLGFISYLDTFGAPPNEPVLCWGAFEVWLNGEGRMKANVDITDDLLKEFEVELLKANDKCDKRFGLLILPE